MLEINIAAKRKEPVKTSWSGAYFGGDGNGGVYVQNADIQALKVQILKQKLQAEADMLWYQGIGEAFKGV